ncbi:MAG: hypothetical protein WAP51_03245 [Candidatus Sungiibacteriota bacterium]
METSLSPCDIRPYPSFENPILRVTRPMLGEVSAARIPEADTPLRTHTWHLRTSDAELSCRTVNPEVRWTLPVPILQGDTWWDCTACGASFCEHVEPYHPMDTWYEMKFIDPGGKEFYEWSRPDVPLCPGQKAN